MRSDVVGKGCGARSSARGLVVLALLAVCLGCALGPGPASGWRFMPGCGNVWAAAGEGAGGRVQPAELTERRGVVVSELPLAVGTVAEYACSDVTSPTAVQVDFPLVGPWSFMSGPGTRLVNTIIDPVEAPDSHRFPKARIVARSETVSVKGRRYATYTFMSLEEDGLRTWGSVFVTGGSPTGYEVYLDRGKEGTPAAYRFLLPATAGDVWEDSVDVDTPGGRYGLTIRHSVVAQGTVTVPAGSFECLLIRQDHRVTRQGQPDVTQTYYYWTSPKVGDVVVVGSLPNEKSESFKRASLFARLVRFEPGR